MSLTNELNKMCQSCTLCFLCFIQILTSVRVMTPTTVMRMHSALTQWGVTPALVTLVTREMVSTVQVSLRAAFLIAVAHYGLN